MAGANPDPKQVERLVKLYTDAQERILAQVQRAEGRGNSTAHLQAVSDEIAKLLRDLDAGARTWTGEAVPRAYTVGVEAANKSLKGLGPQADFAGVHRQAAQILADNTYSRLSAVTTAIGRQTDDYLRSIALDAITSPLMGGRNTATSDIFTRMVLQGDGVIRTRPDGSTYLGVQVTPDGKWWDMRTYAEMSARTTLAQTQRAGTEVRLTEAGIDLVIIVGDDTSEDSCLDAMDAGPFSLSGQSDEYPSLDDAIEEYDLFHPQCRHSTAADPSALDALR